MINLHFSRKKIETWYFHSSIAPWVYVFPLALAIFVVRLYLCLPLWRRPKGIRDQLIDNSRFERNRSIKKSGVFQYLMSKNLSTMVILGSGGHTTELLKLIKDIELDNYRPLHYIIACTDNTSIDRIPVHHRSRCRISYIPRCREVGQSWLSTCFSTMKALLQTGVLVFHVRPEFVLVNGPGTCIPICFWAFGLKILGVKPRLKIIFVESFCRVCTLSLTGKLLYPFADRFIVHWPDLVEKYPRSEYIGQLF